MRLYHFSEEAGIERFEPRPPPRIASLVAPATSAGDDETPLVWAIDEWHAPMYYFPRDCPRACFWPGGDTSAADRERWFAGVDAKMVIAIEATWLDRVRRTVLYRYDMPPETFSFARDDDSGHYVSRLAVEPRNVEPMTDLLSSLADAHIELRITPSLQGLWQRITETTLHFSGTRLRNARGWPSS